MRDSGLPEVCANCGDDFLLSEWLPIEVTTDEEGVTDILGLCDKECRESRL